MIAGGGIYNIKCRAHNIFRVVTQRACTSAVSFDDKNVFVECDYLW